MHVHILIHTHTHTLTHAHTHAHKCTHIHALIHIHTRASHSLMEALQGRSTLEGAEEKTRKVRASSPFRHAEVKCLMKQLFDAVAFLHEVGLNERN